MIVKGEASAQESALRGPGASKASFPAQAENAGLDARRFILPIPSIPHRAVAASGYD
jgi:hypothetical protein